MREPHRVHALHSHANKQTVVSLINAIYLISGCFLVQIIIYVIHCIQVHFLCTIDGPASSYSSFLIHISSNVDSEDRMEPPIHTEYFLSGGAMILMVIESGASAVTSFCTRSGIPSHVVVPPDITMFPYPM